MKAREQNSNRKLDVVGHSVARVDARGKVTGEALYSADLFVEGPVLWGKILRSPHAHAEIVRLETSRAAALKGVRAVITFRDVPPNPFEKGDGAAPVYLLDRIVRHVGDEVAAVAADSLEIAEEALGLLEPEYRPLSFVLDAEEALRSDAPEVRGGANLAGGKPILLCRGDVERGMAEADLIVEGSYQTQRTSPLALEPRWCLAEWQDGRLTVWKSSRNVYGDRDRLAKVFGLPPEEIRVIGATMGGGFGSKDESRLASLTALLARQAGLPVKMGYTREEELGFGRWRHPTVNRIRMGLKRDGSITALDSTSILNTGPYAPGFGVAARLGYGLTYLYTCANARFEGKVVFTNSPVAGAYRGLGAPQGHFALESLVDEAAERLKMDPLEFRLKNHVRPEGQPGTPYVPKDELVPGQPIEGGIPFSTNFLAECLKEGARRIGWRARPAGPRKIRVKGNLRGMGMACCIYKTGQSASSAIVEVKNDGSAELRMGIMEIGQGAWTILIQIVAETLGLRYEDVKGSFADTGTTPYSHGSHGSTTTFSSGLTAQRAAEDARRQLIETASRLLEVDPQDLKIKDGLIVSSSAPKLRVPLGKVISQRENRTVIGQAKVRPGSKSHIINSFAAHFAEVEVDTETGSIQVLRYIAVHDSGRAVNPETMRSQIVGGVVQGLGYALMEDLPVDPETGAPLVLNLNDFKIPTVVDLPRIEPVLIEHPDPFGPYGAKAIGEPPLVPVAGAIANAVYDATGVRIRELPLTAEKVLRGLRDGGRGGGSSHPKERRNEI